MTDQRIFNFSAGPATLPLSVLEEARENLLSLPDLGMSVLEISHRSKTFTGIVEETEENIGKLLGLGDDHKVLFLQGGATFQFSMVPTNFLGADAVADYILTGSWGKKAIGEGKKLGTVNVAWDGKEANYNAAPSPNDLSLSDNPAYVHFTSNETIQGVVYSEEPTPPGDSFLVCDMSSDIFSRPIDVSRYGLIYAGAQKNAGPAGVTLAILRKDLQDRIPEGLPSLLDYRTFVKNGSLQNTPPVFSIYMVMLVTRWLLNEIGGLEKMKERNEAKANLLYEAIDGSEGYYRGHAEVKDRSAMNVTWRLGSEDLEAKFVKEATDNGLDGLKGHRSVGGIRASIYNAMPPEGVQALVDFMADFKRRNP